MTHVSALVWWVIPIVITAFAIGIVALRSRMGEPKSDPMAERIRLREAMERQSGKASPQQGHSSDTAR
ncbi:hypothetical protein N9C30_01660 [bacterium]|nr:hypothetical protein [bacterium]MDC3376447.1 hypothetical protein [Candidatus Nanopelagicales bacterium]